MPIQLKPDQLPVNQLIEAIEKNPNNYSTEYVTSPHSKKINLVNYYAIKNQQDSVPFSAQLRKLVTACEQYNQIESPSYFDNVKFAFGLTVLSTFGALSKAEGLGKYLGYLFIGGPVALIGTLAAPLIGLVSWLIDAAFTRSKRSKISTQISQLKDEIRNQATKLEIPLDKAPEQVAEKQTSPALGQLGNAVAPKTVETELKDDAKNKKETGQVAKEEAVANPGENPAATTPPSITR